MSMATSPALRWAELAAAYDLAGTRPALAALRSNRAVMPIWDDHDYGINDGGADFPHKAAAKALFLKFWQIEAGDPRWMRPGLHHAAVFGPEGRRLQVILMDLRSFRTALHPAPQGTAIPGGGRYLPAGPGARMLGEDQWAWLADCFRQPAELRLVVSSVQLVADGHGWEGWSRMPDERARFWRLIRDTGARGVVLLSGDRHLGAIYRRAAGPDGPPYPVTELTSSSVNLPNLAIVDEPGTEPADADLATGKLGPDRHRLVGGHNRSGRGRCRRHSAAASERIDSRDRLTDLSAPPASAEGDRWGRWGPVARWWGAPSASSR